MIKPSHMFGSSYGTSTKYLYENGDLKGRIILGDTNSDQNDQ